MVKNVKTTKILIVGGSGFIGQHLARQLDVNAYVATYRTHEIKNGLRFDSMTMKLCDEIDLSQFSHAVILLGEADTLLCAREPEKTDAINIDSVKSVLNDCQSFGIVPVFVSTDAVFDGTKGDYTEDDVPHPLMRYGHQRLVIEKYIAQNFAHHLIFRPGKVYSASRRDKTFLSRWMNDLENGTLIRCATDHIFCPIEVDDFASLIMASIHKNISGLFHAGGPQKTTYCELVNFLIHHGANLDKVARVDEALINDFAVIDPRPIDSSLVSQKLNAILKMTLKTPEDVCRSIALSKSCKVQ